MVNLSIFSLFVYSLVLYYRSLSRKIIINVSGGYGGYGQESSSYGRGRGGYGAASSYGRGRGGYGAESYGM